MIEPQYARNDSLREFSAIANELKHPNFSSPGAAHGDRKKKSVVMSHRPTRQRPAASAHAELSRGS